MRRFSRWIRANVFTSSPVKVLFSSLPHAFSQQSDRPAACASETYQPTEFPDRVILTFAGDPATSQAVTWRTDASVTGSHAQIAQADHGPQFEVLARSVPATTEELVTSAGKAVYHAAIFDGLKPGTKYIYRVGDGTHWSEWALFQTASNTPEPFRFLYLGDAQNSVKSHWSRVIRAAFRCALDARFIVHAGDLVDCGTDDNQWGQWFDAAGWINTMVPGLPSPGNHEYASQTITAHWRAQFTLPQNGPKGLEESVYYVDYQGARIISLNSNEGQEIQAQWLRQILSTNPCRWAVITFHHPIYSSAIESGKLRDNPELRKLWQPIFGMYHVDLVIQGHDHTYARTGLETTSTADVDGCVACSSAGTVYVNSVSGPKQYELVRTPVQKRTAEWAQLFQVVSIDGDALRFEVRTTLGELYDAFTLRKRAGQANELIEQGPGTPERHSQFPAEEPRAKAALAPAAAVN